MSTAAEQLTNPTRPLNVDYELDDGPGRYKIGLVALSTDHASERDFRNMSPGDEVQFFVSRIRQVNPCTIENLRLMAPQLGEATSLIIPGTRLDSIAYSCTSGTVAIGFDQIRDALQTTRPGVPCTTPITAGLAAFGKLGIRRIALLTPYIDSVNQLMRQFLERHGIEVLSIHSFDLEDDTLMARVPPSAIHEAALQANHPDADAIFISCTALRAAELVDSLERELRKPVITAIQALFWESLRLAGYGRVIDGYGQLLRI